MLMPCALLSIPSMFPPGSSGVIARTFLWARMHAFFVLSARKCDISKELVRYSLRVFCPPSAVNYHNR